MEHWVALVLSASFVVLVVTAGFAVRRPLHRRWLAGTGLEEWRRTASGLSRRDRWIVHRAARRGRAAPGRLADLTRQRAAVGDQVTTRWLEARSGFRTLWRLSAVLFMTSGTVNLVGAVLEPSHALRWVTAGMSVVAVIAWSAVPADYRRQQRRYRRAVELNRAQP